MTVIEPDAVGAVRMTPIGTMTIEDSHIIQYPGGKVFVRYLYADLTKRLAKNMHNNVDRDYDNVIVIQGPEGSGKSSLAWQICHEYDPDFDVRTQYVYSLDDLKKKLTNGDDRHAVWWLDEASNVANNREWASQGNRDLVALLEMMRSRGWTLVMCIPRVERLDIYIRQYRIRYLLTCGRMTFDLGGPKERGYYEARKIIDDRMRLIGYGSYGPIPLEQDEAYRAIKLRSQQDKIREVTEGHTGPGAKYKKTYERSRSQMGAAMLTLHERGIDDDMLMDIFGYSNYGTFRNALTNARKRRMLNQENFDEDEGDSDDDA